MLLWVTLASIPLNAIFPKPASAFGFFVYSFPAFQGPEFISTGLEIEVDASISDSTPEEPNIGIFQDVISSFSYNEFQDKTTFDPDDARIVFPDIQLVKSVANEPGEKFTLKSTFVGDTLKYNFIEDSEKPDELITDFSGNPLALNVEFLAITDVLSDGFRVLAEPRTLTDVQKEKVVNSLEFYDQIILQDSSFEGSLLDGTFSFFDPEETEEFEFRIDFLQEVDKIPLALVVDIAESITEKDESELSATERKLIGNLIQLDPRNPPPVPVPTPSMLPGLLLSAFQFLKLRKAKLAKAEL